MSSSRRYPVNFVHQPPREIPVTCAICLDVLFQPKIVSCCGHSFCANCIGRVARDRKPCPLCGRHFVLTDNQWLERTLNDYDVYCPHKEKGCEWVGQLRQLENHLNQNPLPDKLCQYELIRCQRCHSHLCERRLMPNHFSNECLYRDIECRYCHVGCTVKQPEQQMREHMREAVGDHLDLVIKRLSQKGSEIAELKQQLWTLTLLLVLVAGGIFHAYAYQAHMSESKVNTMEVIMKELVHNHSQYAQKLANFSNAVESLSSDIGQIRKNITHIKVSADNAAALDKVRQSVKRIPSVEAKVSEIERQVVSGKKELKKLIQTEKDNLKIYIDKTIKDLEVLKSTYRISTEKQQKELEDIKTQVKKMNSMASWICNDSNSSSVAKEFEKMKYEVLYISQQADFPILPVSLNLTQVRKRKDSGDRWLSMPFYTHQGGYKMRLVVYPNGKGSRAGTHTYISVAICLMSGKYDAKLEWPPKITLKVTLIDQLSPNNYSLSEIYDTWTYKDDVQVTGRVWDDTMAKYGLIHRHYASHRAVFKPTNLHSYIKHGSLYFKVSRVENGQWYKFW